MVVGSGSWGLLETPQRAIYHCLKIALDVLQMLNNFFSEISDRLTEASAESLIMIWDVFLWVKYI